MEVRKGYKQTEVGVIPEDWEVKELDSFSDVSSGGTPNRSIASYWNGNIPWITTSQINFNTIHEANEFISEDGLNYSATKKYKAGTLLMAMYGQGKTRGKVAILGIDATINQACAAISLNNCVLNEYIFCNLSARYNEIRGLSNSGSQENLNSDLIKRILIPLPTKSEQSAISTAIIDADTFISSLEKLLEKKQAIKQGAMQELLRPKEGWMFDKVKNIASISNGAKNTQDKIDDGLYSFFVRSDKIERINSYSFDGEAILVAGDGVGTGKVVNYFNGKFDFHQRVYKISDFQNGVNGFYFYLYFKNNFYNRVMQMTAKSSVDSVRMEMIAEMNIYFPLIEEQILIATILSDMDAEIEGLEEKLSKYKMVKQGMMQELLTGRIRLSADFGRISLNH